MKISPHRNQGFTLVELLVVLAISGIVLTGVLKVFSSSQATYNVQEEVAAMQQNVRTAKMFLERDIRMAGSGAMNLQGPNGGILPLWFENGHGANGTDRLTVIYNNPDGDCGTLTAGATILCNSLPSLTLETGITSTDTALSLVEELNDAEYNPWLADTCSCNGAEYAPGSDMPFVISTPGKNQSSILIRTAISSGAGSDDSLTYVGPVAHASIPAPGGDLLYNFLDESDTTISLANTQPNDFEANSKIDFFNMYKAVYYVDNDVDIDGDGTGDGLSVLYRDTGNGPEVIAEHIEDFQCSFELEDGTVINHRNLTAAEIPEVRLVTINVVARSGHQHRNRYGNFNGQRMALEDHGAGPADKYRRRLLTVTVKVRNFGL